MRKIIKLTITFIICFTLLLLINFSSINYFDNMGFLTLSQYSGISTIKTCTYHTCLDIYQCSLEKISDSNHISVFVYHDYYFKDNENSVFLTEKSKEFMEVMEAVKSSKYYVEDPQIACLFLPNLDFLNLNKIPAFTASRLINSLPSWSNGSNHLLFNMLPKYSSRNYPATTIATGLAIIAGGNFSPHFYRPTFDIIIPVYNPYITSYNGDIKRVNLLHLMIPQWLLISKHFKELINISLDNPENILLLDNCNISDINGMDYRCTHPHGTVVNYQDSLSQSDFCVVYRYGQYGQASLFDAMARNCVPLILDSALLPFFEVLDWKKCSVTIDRSDIANIASIINSFTRDEIHTFRRHVRHFYTHYMATMSRIAVTTLDIMNDRVYTSSARSYEEWNNPDYHESLDGARQPLFYPQKSSPEVGFTLVMKLTTPKWESVIHNLLLFNNVRQILTFVILWNTESGIPPPAHNWPKLSKPIKIIELTYTDNEFTNQMSLINEISTESVVYMHGDQPLLTTADDIQDGFKVWCQYADRLVGISTISSSSHFESRYSNLTAFTSFSIIFYHKYYGRLFQSYFDVSARQLIQSIVGCSEIAFKYFVLYLSRASPMEMLSKSHVGTSTGNIVDGISYDKCIDLLSSKLDYYPSIRFQTTG